MNLPLRAAVVGVGHMGRHHARIYAEMPATRLVGVVDIDGERAARVAAEYGCSVIPRLEDLIGKVDAVSVAVPTVDHVAVAQPLLEAGIAVLVEKPLAPSAEEARRLIGIAERSGALVQVGHTERFNPVVRAIQRMEITPKFVEAQRISPFTFRSADVGVVFDMMIHDIDIILHLVRSEVATIDAVGVAVLSSNEDIANARVRFANGSVANLTASRLALKTERRIRVFSPEAYLSLDYQQRRGIAIRKTAHEDILEIARRRGLRSLAELAAQDYSSLVRVEPLSIEDTEPLRAELEAFVRAVATGEPPPVTAADGLAAVELASRITASIREQRWEVEP